MRTSSSRPLKYCHPPIRTGAVDVASVPVCARLATWVPFTYSRICAPSYVAARCVHVFTGNAVGRPLVVDVASR